MIAIHWANTYSMVFKSVVLDILINQRFSFLMH